MLLLVVLCSVCAAQTHGKYEQGHGFIVAYWIPDSTRPGWMKNPKKYVQDDHCRRILGQKTAGLENGSKWANSDSDFRRDLAIQASEPIDTRGSGGATADGDFERLFSRRRRP